MSQWVSATAYGAAHIPEYHTNMKLLQFCSLLLVPIVAIASGQIKPKHDIVATLLPKGEYSHPILKLSPAEKQQAIKQLQTVQKRAMGERRVQVAFLLAALGSDYDRNSNYLIRNVRECAGSSPEVDCDEYAAGNFLIALYKRGHRDVLKPLMLTGLDSYNAAFSEMLGDFLSTLLIKNPTVFLNTIRPLAPGTQGRLCDLAERTDGSGMSLAALRSVRRNLNAAHGELASSCLRAVEAANRDRQNLVVS